MAGLCGALLCSEGDGPRDEWLDGAEGTCTDEASGTVSASEAADLGLGLCMGLDAGLESAGDRSAWAGCCTGTSEAA